MTRATYERRALRGADLLGLSLSALRQQKVRTILTMVGVVVGTFALALSVSVGRGVDRAIVALFQSEDRLRKIGLTERFELPAEAVSAEESEPKGSMSDAKRQRIRKSLMRTLTNKHTHAPLAPMDPKGLERVRALDHVVRVEPFIYIPAKASLDGASQDAFATSNNAAVDFLRDRLLAGQLLTPDGGPTALVHEYFLYRLGIAGDDVHSVLGRTIRLEPHTRPPSKFDLAVEMALGFKEARTLESGLKRMAALVRSVPIPPDEQTVLLKLFEPTATLSPSAKPPGTYSREFTIVGVVRDAEFAEKPGPFSNAGIQDADILLPPGAAEALFADDPANAESRFHYGVVTVDREEHVKEVSSRLYSMGFGESSPGSFIDTVRLNLRMITFAMAFVALVALLVAAVGITNTMIMSVLERTHEIGVMKALGARDRHIQLIFLVEGVVIGAVGSSLGLALSWLASFPGDSIARAIMESQTNGTVRGTLFVFPFWLVVGVPLVVCLITTLAALYPAFRAARVDPVTSLRHE